MATNPFRNLPSVNAVLEAPAIQALEGQHAHELIVAAIRQELDSVRQRLGQGETIDGQAGADMISARVVERLGRELRPKLRRVINGTGIILHTNLGRAPTAELAAKAA